MEVMTPNVTLYPKPTTLPRFGTVGGFFSQFDLRGATGTGVTVGRHY